jgi:hypothetical protein
VIESPSPGVTCDYCGYAAPAVACVNGGAWLCASCLDTLHYEIGRFLFNLEVATAAGRREMSGEETPPTKEKES